MIIRKATRNTLTLNPNMKKNSLKKLKTELRLKKEEHKAVHEQLTSLSRKASQLRVDIEKIEKRISFKTDEGLVVTEHAVIRFLERVNGIEIEPFRDRIKKELTSIVDKMGDGEWPCCGLTAVVVNNTVVTLK